MQNGIVVKNEKNIPIIVKEFSREINFLNVGKESRSFIFECLINPFMNDVVRDTLKDGKIVVIEKQLNDYDSLFCNIYLDDVILYDRIGTKSFYNFSPKLRKDGDKLKALSAFNKFADELHKKIQEKEINFLNAIALFNAADGTELKDIENIADESKFLLIGSKTKYANDRIKELKKDASKLSYFEYAKKKEIENKQAFKFISQN
jgi:hypothetical protein